MKKVILFSPNGYVGSFIKERIAKEKDIQLYTMTRDSGWTQYEDSYDIMIYSAAITSSRQESADKYVQDNVVTAVRAVDFCRKHHIQRVIYISSDEIYGELSTDVVSEKAVMINPNLYAATKYLAEKIIIESGIRYYILRLPGVVGKIWGHNFICRLMDSIKKSDPLELYNVHRDFNNILDVEDLAEFLSVLCMRGSGGRSEIFLLGNTEKVKLFEVICYMKKLHHSISKITSMDTDENRYFTLDVTKAVEYGYSSKSIWMIIDDLYRIQESVGN